MNASELEAAKIAVAAYGRALGDNEVINHIVTAQWCDSDKYWLVVMPSRTVIRFNDQDEVTAAIKKFNARMTKKTGETTCTMINWRNVPHGFKAP